MKQLVITGLVLVISLFLVSLAYADETTGTGEFTGTWTDANYTFIIFQNGTEITLTGVPFDEYLDIPMKFTGTVSENGTSLFTVKKMNGTHIIRMSDDLMKISGIQTFEPIVPSGIEFTNFYNATRNETRVSPGAIWSGEWIGSNTSMTLNQTGKVISGFYNEILEPEPRVDVEGFVSADGKKLSLNWTFTENINFTLSDDRMHLIEDACGEKEIANGSFCLNLTRRDYDKDL
jgi:hypothetical protein